METITINVECAWEKSDSKYCDSGYSGYWQIVGPNGTTHGHPKGYPQINGGCHTPDMCALWPDVESLRQKFLNEYKEWEMLSDKKIIVDIKVIKDDREGVQSGLEQFF
jgi:hypothetical protein